jgi:serine/threonine protein kinase/tetratricopeptide (TPR) repeat protein
VSKKKKSPPDPAGETIDELQEITEKLLRRPIFDEGEVADAKLAPSEEGPMLPPGTLFGKFEIVRLLGRGGAGEVYLANDRSLQRPIALKVLSRVAPADVERFRREAQLAAKLSHPNIVPIHEIGEEQGRPYLSMPFIEGSVIDRCPLNTREILRAMIDVALAVHYAHSQGIVHRDIKPSNLMIDRFGHVYLTDFGVARQSIVAGPEGGQATEVIAGTPCYMSPEQARGETQLIDARTDVYALGATLFKLLTRTDPFSGNSAFDILQRVVSWDAPRPSRLQRSLTREFDVVIGKAMEKERERRYPDARALAEDLRRLHDGEPILALPSPLSYRVGKAIRKHRTAASLTVLLILIVAGGAGLLISYRSESETARRQKRAADHITRGRKHTDGVMDLSGRESSDLMAKWVELAVHAYDLAAEEDPSDPTPVILKAATLYWSGDASEAQRLLARAESMPGAEGDYRIPFLLGRILLDDLADREPLPLYEATKVGPRFLHPGRIDEELEARRREAKRLFGQARDLSIPLAEQDQEANLDRTFSAGAIAYLEGRAGQAAAAWSRAVRGGLRARDAEQLLGLALYRNREFESAVGVFHGLVNVRYRPAITLRLLGLSLLAHGVARSVFDLEAESHYLDARRVLTDALRQSGDGAEAHFGRGAVHFALGYLRQGQGDDPTYMDYRRGIEDLTRAVSLDVRHSVAHRTLGQVWSAIGQLQIRQGKPPTEAFRKAREHFDEAMLLDPTDPDTLTFRGEVHLAQAIHRMRNGEEPHEELQRALDYGDAARRLAPDHLEGRDLRVRAYRRLAEYERAHGWTSEENLRRAEEECRHALLRVDSNAWLLHRQAQLQWDRVEEVDLLHEETADAVLHALNAVERAVERQPTLGPAQALRARILVEAGLQEERAGRDPLPRWEAAAAAASAALKSNDRLFEALIARALLNMAWGDHERRKGKDPFLRYEEARAALDDAATVAPGEPELYFIQALLSMTRGQYPKAIEALRRCQAAGKEWQERAERYMIVARRYLEGF